MKNVFKNMFHLQTQIFNFFFFVTFSKFLFHRTQHGESLVIIAARWCFYEWTNQRTGFHHVHQSPTNHKQPFLQPSPLSVVAGKNPCQSNVSWLLKLEKFNLLKQKFCFKVKCIYCFWLVIFKICTELSF